jgi:hypothetical protein
VLRYCTNTPAVPCKMALVRGAHNTPEARYVVLGPFPCEAEGKEKTGRMNENQEALL